MIQLLTDGKTLLDDIKDKSYTQYDINEIINLIETVFNYSMFISTMVVVARCEKDKIIGCCILEFTNGLNISAFCVEEKYRNKGIGKLILKKVDEIGRYLNKYKPEWKDLLLKYNNGLFIEDNYTYMTLEVAKYSKDYEKLVCFYKKNGFEYKEVPGYCHTYFRKKII